MSLPDFITVVPVQAIASPCINVCRIGRDRLCEGCRRTTAEIARWTSMTPAERDAVMAELPGR
ncbi:MAG: DUF1289 domain-containing protein [Sphingomonas sp.]|uniref:DUF1289 domain-containing protein n=1 Tax=Sphingomonas sp. TaxID=28214 RepID=UPI001AD42F27|nr:DUF1289 domain-containing protein [Sphingomonas sp.]MBN8808720.1 DUF1289 domain-containing protein [Sphingomonas sp.]